jgi:Ca2+-binding RTX toxin-like protein
MTTLRIPRYSAALATVAAAAAFAVPATANAATTAALNGTNLTITGDEQPDRIVIGDDGNGLLTNNFGGTTTTDFGNNVTVPANGTVDLVFNAGAGDDAVTITTGLLKTATVNGGDGDDTITGSPNPDFLHGDAGNDRVIGFRGGDTMTGDAGNDVLVWNNGDGSDKMDDSNGNDEVEVNGDPTQGDTFQIAPNAAEPGRTRFDRLNLVPFNLNIAPELERIVVNGGGGADVVTTLPGAPILPVLNGGAGNDELTGGERSELITGGEGNDTLNGGGGNDRIVGDRGGDTFNGGDGDDTLVWNNGDGSDTMNGEGGLDRTEVNGDIANGDAFTIKANGPRSQFDRVNLVAFKLDIDVEALDVRGLGGDDSFNAAGGTGAHLAVTVDGGAGNDQLAGAEEADTLSGGSGNDNITGGAGPDVLDGNDGDDQLFARDGQTDLIRGGAGNDSAQGDAFGVDNWDGVENVDATPVVTPPPADTQATPVSIGGGKTKLVSIKKGRASVKLALSCPAAEAGGCKGTVALISSKAVKIGNQRVRVVVGNASYTLKAGEKKNVTVRLPKGVRKIAKNRKLAVRAQTITSDAAGNVATGSRSLTLRIPAKK